MARTPIDSKLHVVDLAAETPEWQELEASGDVPPERIAHTQGVIGGGLYIFGGRQGITMGEGPLNDMYRYDLASGSWSLVEPVNGQDVPCARSFHAMAVSGAYLYVFGGCAAEGRLNDLHRFDTGTSAWEQMPTSDAIAGRGGPCLLAAPGGALFVVAGFAGQEMDDIHRFDPELRTWTRLLQPPGPPLRPRSVSAHVALNGGLACIFGGEVDPSEKGHEGAGGFANDALLFDTDTGAITPVQGLGDGGTGWRPRERGWTSMGVLADGSPVVFGGLAGNDEAPERLNDLCILTLG